MSCRSNSIRRIQFDKHQNDWNDEFHPPKPRITRSHTHDAVLAGRIKYDSGLEKSISIQSIQSRSTIDHHPGVKFDSD